MSELTVRHTDIPGLLVVDLPLHGDARGWFKENWQRAKMTALGLPDFAPVQHSVAHNGPAGVTRGIHAEPWDKFVSAVAGEFFGAWVDLREGTGFGRVHTERVGVDRAVFVPRGVGNAYQTQVEGTVYSYLVNAHWSPDAAYTHLNLADPTVAIPWPVPLDRAEISDKDRSHPRLADVEPVPPVRTLIIGGGGQVGTALRRQFPLARAIGREELDLAVPGQVEEFDFSGFDVVINAAAFTAVDRAETDEGRRAAWATNASAVAALARAVLAHGSTLVHYSTDYVFDGTEPAWAEDSPLAPSNVYGQSKAAGDLAVSVLPRHYLIRTSWVIGEGHNFVRTMQRLAGEGASPTVVDDQIGRLTFTGELARATAHLLDARAPYGTYHATNGGAPMSWYDVARLVFDAEGRDPGDVVPVATAERVTGAGQPVARRPLSSVLGLERLEATGFVPAPADEQVRRYLRRTEPW